MVKGGGGHISTHSIQGRITLTSLDHFQMEMTVTPLENMELLFAVRISFLVIKKTVPGINF